MPLNIDEIRVKISAVKIFLFDLQGVLIPENENGRSERFDLIESLKEFNDFCLKNSLSCGIITGISEGEILNEIQRVGGIEIVSASLDKVSAAEKITAEKSCGLNEAFFMGDGLLDLPLLNKVGLSAAPETAARQIKKSVDFICPGKTGAERLEFILSLLKNVAVQLN